MNRAGNHFLFNKTRLAPTPSGFLHLGNIYSFVITVALARSSGAKVLLRIDDADRERTNKVFVQDIFDTLSYLDIPFDEGPLTIPEYETIYSQVHRMDTYYKALHQLRDAGKLFACTCTRTQVVHGPDSVYPGTCRHKNIPFDAPNVSWRIIEDETELEVKGVDGSITKAQLPANMRNFIVRKKDGFPAYQLTSLLDDIHFGIDLVVRGEDLWASTLAQLYLASLLGSNTFSNTSFYHHPLISGADGNKLSKSEGATSVHYLRDHDDAAGIYTLLAHTLNISGSASGWTDLARLIYNSDYLPGISGLDL